MSTNDQNLSKEKLLAEVERMKKELKNRKKYGLVWEDKPEEVVEMCKKRLPVLKEVKEKEIITDKSKPVNLLIEGDNYHALSVLNYTHAGKIDVIYIDPPYNTGNKDFIFNDNYVDREDSYRHSKWLSFMEKRLKLAKNLLKDTGVIFISIDDNEVAQLKLLMDNPDLFGENNFVTILSIQMSTVQGEKVGAAKKGTIVKNTEFCLIYSRTPNKQVVKNILYDPTDYDPHYSLYISLINKDQKIYEMQSLSSVLIKEREIFKELSILGLLKNGKLPQSQLQEAYRLSGLVRDFINKNKENIVRIHDVIKIKDLKGVPREISKGYIVEYNSGKRKYLLIKRKNKFYQVIPVAEKIRMADDFYKTLGPTTIRGDWWPGFYLDMGNINKEGDVNFGEGKKPLRLIKQLIHMVASKDAIVLDFFAGSGTTGEAVLDLNKEDGGNRQFILCTNNRDENGGHKIATDICYPRLKNSISGYRNKQGLGGNLKYFRTDFVDAEPSDKNKIKLTHQATEMLCVKEGTFEKVVDNERFKIFKNLDHYTGIIWDQTAISEFKKAIKDIKGKFSVYVFSLGDETFDEEFNDVKQKVHLSPIPEAILRVYRRIFK
jgi:adenine-specific DNA-methyltransferase